jgi:hypothetical protein
MPKIKKDHIWALVAALLSFLALWFLLYIVSNLISNLFSSFVGTSLRDCLILDAIISFVFSFTFFFVILIAKKSHARFVVLFCAVSMFFYWGFESKVFWKGFNSTRYPAWYEINMALNDFLTAALTILLHNLIARCSTKRTTVGTLTMESHMGDEGNEQKNTENRVKPKRPKLVWVISIFYLFSMAWTLLSFTLIYNGDMPMTEAQKHYFSSETLIDIISMVVTSSLSMAGAMLLFMLKREAFYAFAWALILSIFTAVYHILFKNFVAAIGVSGLINFSVTWCISVAILLYSFSLENKGILN